MVTSLFSKRSYYLFLTLVIRLPQSLQLYKGMQGSWKTSLDSFLFWSFRLVNVEKMSPFSCKGKSKNTLITSIMLLQHVQIIPFSGSYWIYNTGHDSKPFCHVKWESMHKVDNSLSLYICLLYNYIYNLSLAKITFGFVTRDHRNPQLCLKKLLAPTCLEDSFWYPLPRYSPRIPDTFNLLFLLQRSYWQYPTIFEQLPMFLLVSCVKFLKGRKTSCKSSTFHWNRRFHFSVLRNRINLQFWYILMLL